MLRGNTQAKTPSPAAVGGCSLTKCKHIFGFYYNHGGSVITYTPSIGNQPLTYLIKNGFGNLANDAPTNKYLRVSKVIKKFLWWE